MIFLYLALWAAVVTVAGSLLGYGLSRTTERYKPDWGERWMLRTMYLFLGWFVFVLAGTWLLTILGTYR